MNQWDFSFEPSVWEDILEALPAGSKLSAARFLALMEPETEEVVSNALQLLKDRDILLVISDLPKNFGTGEIAARLRTEEQLVKNGNLPQGLEETDPLRLYLEELAAIPAFGDIHALAERYLQGDDSVVAMLTNLMLSSVISRAYEYVGYGVLLMDLIQDGSLGLWQAILNYQGGDIENHCRHYIEHAMAKTVVLQARENGIGQKMRQALEDYRAVDERLLTELGRNPTLEEIAEQLHISPEEAAAVAETLDAARMIDRAKAVPEEKTEEDEHAVEDTAYFQMRQRIQELLSGLSEQDVKLLTLRFGLEGGLPLSPEDAGRKLGLTPEEVVAREAAVLMQLRGN